MSTNCYWIALVMDQSLVFSRSGRGSATVATAAAESITLTTIRPLYKAPLLDG